MEVNIYFGYVFPEVLILYFEKIWYCDNTNPQYVIHYIGYKAERGPWIVVLSWSTQRKFMFFLYSGSQPL